MLKLSASVLVFVFGVPHKGSSERYLVVLLYIIIATGMGLLISTFMKSQIAAIFGIGHYHVYSGDTVFGTIIW